MISNYGLPFTILLILAVGAFIIEYSIVAGVCWICRRMRRFKLNSVERKAKKFKDISDWLAVFGNNTYDPFENNMYWELLVAIEDAATVDWKPKSAITGIPLTNYW